MATRASAPALLVLSDTHYPGWEAFLDGKPVHIYTVDSILRGVAVPTGSHELHFRYRPRAFTIGAGVSIAGLVGLALAMLYRGRTRTGLHEL